MKNHYFKEIKFQASDPIENYFECILTFDIKDSNCVSRFVEILKQNDD